MLQFVNKLVLAFLHIVEISQQALIGHRPTVLSLGIVQALRDLLSALTYEPVSFTKMEITAKVLLRKI